MTIEQINKGADSYIELISAGKASEEMKGVLKSAFASGSHMANEYWQEKTRWIPVEERLPAFEGKRRTILVKTGDDLYSFLWIIQEVSLSDFECQGYTHWKEIEL